MKTAIISGLAATGYLLSSATAALHVPIIKNRHVEAQQLQAAQLRRRGTVTESLGNAQQFGLYYANVTAGTPAQELSLQIDTGSSDVWLPSSDAQLCNMRGQGCEGGSFDSSASSTFQIVGQDEFNISYVDGTGSLGSYFTDTFGIGGKTIKNFEMGLGEETTISIGILGIGYANSVANVFTGSGTSYVNLPLALVNAGLINSPAYSLWLDDIQSSAGSILFGGIDTAKFTGQMQSIKVYPSSKSGNVTSFTVAFTSLQASSSSGTDLLTPANYAQPAILDSGTTLTLLPDDIASLVFQELGAIDDQELDAVVVPCALGSNSGSLKFGFGGTGGPVINVPVSELVLPLTLSNGGTPRFENGADACQLGIQAAGNLPILFGDTFLRSAYVVYDLANNEVGLAQTDFNAKGSNIVEFASMGAQIPQAPTATGQNQIGVSQTKTGIPRGGEATQSADGDGVVQGNATPTGAAGLTAASGFGNNDGDDESAGGRLEPPRWGAAAFLGAWMGIMMVGGGMFTLA
ncbi:hypothetical protein O988_07216 [Pseudogymnoascus sp. VKM F-3808]|nr:hypothetical protein O988_07216 [Pseudogymnoascus sp. VKM F-3808]